MLRNALIATGALLVGIVVVALGVYIIMAIIDYFDLCFGPRPPLSEEETTKVEMVMMKNSTRPYEKTEDGVPTEDEESADDSHCCAICLEAFVEGAPVIQPSCCAKQFHADCFQQWRATSQTCPHCRQLHLFTEEQWRKTAKNVLGKRRVRGIYLPRSVAKAAP